MPARFLNWGVPAPECLDLELSNCNIFPDPGKSKSKTWGCPGGRSWMSGGARQRVVSRGEGQRARAVPPRSCSKCCDLLYLYLYLYLTNTICICINVHVGNGVTCCWSPPLSSLTSGSLQFCVNRELFVFIVIINYY